LSSQEKFRYPLPKPILSSLAEYSFRWPFPKKIIVKIIFQDNIFIFFKEILKEICPGAYHGILLIISLNHFGMANWSFETSSVNFIAFLAMWIFRVFLNRK